MPDPNTKVLLEGGDGLGLVIPLGVIVIDLSVVPCKKICETAFS